MRIPTLFSGLAAGACTALLAGAALADHHEDMAAKTPDQSTIGSMATASFVNLEGESIGSATLTQGPAGVLLHLRVSGLEPGKHGLHIHHHGSCTHASSFKSAEGHVGVEPGRHGLLNAEGPEPGDLPNLFVHEDGTGEMEAFTTFVSLIDGPHPLLDDDGSALVIHEAGDDHMAQPIGGSGGRVACAELHRQL